MSARTDTGSRAGAADASPGAGARWLTEEEQAAWRAYITASTMVHRQLNADMLAAHDLSMDDYGILAMLSEAEHDRLRFGELAEVLRVPKAHITYRFRRLEKQGLVRREPCPTDARGAFAVLTVEGRTRIEQAAPTHVESVRSTLLDHLTEEQLRVIGEGMRAVSDAACGDGRLRH